MKATIDRKTYDTSTAEELAFDSGGYCNDFRHWEETLYKTKKGSYFIHGRGGPMSRYSEACGDGNSYGSGSAIVPITEDEALAWCEEHDCQDVIEGHFSHLVEEA